MNETEYKNECDRLATLEIGNEFTSFGRWFLEDGLICTWVCVPKIGVHVVQKLFKYEVMVITQDQQDSWLNRLKSKDWIGAKGIKDLKRAFKYLNKRVKVKESEG